MSSRSSSIIASCITAPLPLVLRPDSTEQVAAIMKLCNEARIGVVPVGGNTSYCGGATPSSDGSQIVLSLARMRRIRTLDPANYTMIAEAGCVLAEIQAAAASVDRLFPMSLGSEGSCQLGGNLSTNAGGTAVLRYGMMRDLVLGLEVVLPDGRVLDGLKPLRKDNTGYDLRDLFIGAEGTLGIITAAACKLFSRPAWTLTAFVGVPEPQAAVALLSRLRAFTSDAVTTFELVPRIALDLVLQHVPSTSDPLDRPHPWYVLLEIGMGRGAAAARESIEAELAAAMEAGEIADAAIAASEAQREMFWRLRETIPEAQRREGASIKHDISVTTGELPRFIVEGARAGCTARAGRATRFVRPSRRRQPAFQPEPAARRQRRRIPAPRAAGQSRRARSGRALRRQLQRRARHRPAQARRAAALQASGRDRADALDQAGRRPERHHESRQGPVASCPPFRRRPS